MSFLLSIFIFFIEIAYLQELNESLKDRFDVKSSLKQLKAKFLNMQKDEKEHTDKVDNHKYAIRRQEL